MDDDLRWFGQFNNSETKIRLKKNPIAYFCAEYALTASLPIYAGGLGVLAGDILREANDHHFPLVAIGLYYNDGYETLHKVDEKGYIEAPHVHKSPESYGLEQVCDRDAKPITITIPIENRQVAARVWRWQVGIIPVFLLDTDCPENSTDDKRITNHLYVIDPQTRLKQEIVLGIGGAKMLDKFGVKPSAYHMNEGHAALLALEVAAQKMRQEHLGIDDAIAAAREKIVFTNHTLVAGGQEIFSNDLLSLLLSSYAAELGVPLEKMISLGQVADSNSFSLVQLALNTSALSNGVSRIHVTAAEKLWPNHQLIQITNGIHLPTWDAIVDENNSWEAHFENKRALLEEVRILKDNAWNENDLIIGWARRLVSYKRPMALLEDVAALKQLLSNSERPFKLIFSGRLHPSDAEGAGTLNTFHKIIETELAGHAVFLPEYDLDLARLMTAGCDVWVNTPIVGFEACGTSGMKAALNGVLLSSTRDGWIAEIELLDKGWALDDTFVNKSFLGVLENDILPLYYDRDVNGVPQNWVRNMKNCRDLIKNEFSTTRMLREYIEKLYLPLLSPK